MKPNSVSVLVESIIDSWLESSLFWISVISLSWVILRNDNESVLFASNSAYLLATDSVFSNAEQKPC